MKVQKKVSKGRLQSSYLTTIVSITLVLFMLGLLGLILLNSKKIADHVRENIGFSIIMYEGVREARIMELKKTLDASDFVKYTEYITSDELLMNCKINWEKILLAFWAIIRCYQVSI
jgi:cell division transport system permease protein